MLRAALAPPVAAANGLQLADLAAVLAEYWFAGSGPGGWNKDFGQVELPLMLVVRGDCCCFRAGMVAAACSWCATPHTLHTPWPTHPHASHSPPPCPVADVPSPLPLLLPLLPPPPPPAALLLRWCTPHAAPSEVLANRVAFLMALIDPDAAAACLGRAQGRPSPSPGPADDLL